MQPCRQITSFPLPCESPLPLLCHLQLLPHTHVLRHHSLLLAGAIHFYALLAAATNALRLCQQFSFSPLSCESPCPYCATCSCNHAHAETPLTARVRCHYIFCVPCRSLPSLARCNLANISAFRCFLAKGKLHAHWCGQSSWAWPSV